MMNFRPVMGGGEVTAQMCQVKSVGEGEGLGEGWESWWEHKMCSR